MASPAVGAISLAYVSKVFPVQKKKRSEAELQQYQHDWKQHVLRLKEYFDNQGLENADPLGIWLSACHCMQDCLEVALFQIPNN